MRGSGRVASAASTSVTPSLLRICIPRRTFEQHQVSQVVHVRIRERDANIERVPRRVPQLVPGVLHFCDVVCDVRRLPPSCARACAVTPAAAAPASPAAAAAAAACAQPVRASGGPAQADETQAGAGPLLSCGSASVLRRCPPPAPPAGAAAAAARAREAAAVRLARRARWAGGFDGRGPAGACERRCSRLGSSPFVPRMQSELIDARTAHDGRLLPR
jgi:hypothetical protein